MSSDGTNSPDFVGRDADSQTGTADQESAVRLSISDKSCSFDSLGWVGSLVVSADADIGDRFDTGVILVVGFDLLLVSDASLLKNWKSS